MPRLRIYTDEAASADEVDADGFYRWFEFEDTIRVGVVAESLGCPGLTLAFDGEVLDPDAHLGTHQSDGLFPHPAAPGRVIRLRDHGAS